VCVVKSRGGGGGVLWGGGGWGGRGGFWYGGTYFPILLEADSFLTNLITPTYGFVFPENVGGSESKRRIPYVHSRDAPEGVWTYSRDVLLWSTRSGPPRKKQ